MKASNIIGMEVINLYEGQVDGYVKNLVFSKDYKKIIGLIIYNDKTENQYYLSVKNIYKINDIVFTKNNTVYDENTSFFENSPINLPCYFSNGTSLGAIIDIELDEKFNILSFITKNKIIKNSIAKITKELVIFNCDECVIKTHNFAPKKKIKQTKNNITVITNNTNINNSFLIGRKVTKDIFTFNNELLIKNGTIITERIVKLARLNGKLRELALNII